MHLILVSIHPYPSPQAVPLANAFLQSFLASRPAFDEPNEITRQDFFVTQEAAACVELLLTQQPAAIGFSMYAWNRDKCREMARQLSVRLPGVLLFAGGPEATADAAGVLAEAPFDFLVVGEGEEPFAEVCSRLVARRGFDDIPGIATRGAQGTALVPGAALSELDEIPSPWLSGVLDARKYPGILWQLSRGCGFACDFCFDSRGSHGVRRFSLERIEAELRHFAASAVTQIFVLDSTFNQDAQRAKTILRLIKKIAPHIHFHFEVRSEFIDREMAQLFAQITCSLQIGLQSADPQIMQAVGRKFNRKDFAAKAALLNESGAVFGFDLMYGLPGDSLSGFSASVDFALGLYPNHLDIFPLAILPGTALAERSAAAGLQHLPAPPYTLISSPTFSVKEMAEASQLAAACDIFYTRGKAVAWFNSVRAALGLRPAAFLERFGQWLAKERGTSIAETDLDDGQIWRMQRTFLTQAFGTKKLKSMLPLALDLVDYHYHYAAALLTPPPETPDERQLAQLQLLEIPCRLAPSARLAGFQYEILDILESGELELRSFCQHYAPNGSWAVIYPRSDGIYTESLIEPYYQLLQQSDGRTPCGHLVEKLNIPDDEALSFLEFAVAEGILIPD